MAANKERTAFGLNELSFQRCGHAPRRRPSRLPLK